MTEKTVNPLKEFYLQRIKDESGVSGTGIVARGMILPSGKCVLEWLSFYSSVNVYKNIEDVKHIHGHDGATEVVFGTPPKAPSHQRTKK